LAGIEQEVLVCFYVKGIGAMQNACSDIVGKSTGKMPFSVVMVIVLVIVSKVRWFKPSRERWIFKGDGNQ
jgi:hypothetical protein